MDLTGRKKLALCGLIVGIALLVRLTGLVVYGVEDQTGDAVDFDRIGVNLAQGHGYSLSQSAPFELTTERDPLYPIALGLLYRLVGHSTLVAIMIQCFVGAAACALIYAITQRVYGSKRVALLAALLNAGYVPIAIFNLRLQTETLAIILLGLIAVALVRLVQRDNNWVDFLLLGTATGLLILTKSAFALLPVVLVPLAVYAAVGRHRLVKGLVSLALVAGLVAPWLIFNKQVHGSYSVGHSLRFGANVYGRVANAGMKAPLDMRTDFYLHLLDLKKQGIPTRELNAACVRQAMQIIREHPIRYLAGTLLEVWDLWRFSVNPQEIDATGQITLTGTKGRVFLGVKYVFLVLNFLVLLTGLAGFGLHPNRPAWMLMAIIAYSTAVFTLVSAALPRHNVFILQLMLIFAAFVLVRMTDWWRRSVRTLQGAV